MNNLQSFLAANPVDNVVQKVRVSERLRDFEFEVKAVTGKEYNSYQSMCIMNANSPKKRSFDTKRFNELLVINHTVNPNFKDTEFINSCGCVDPAGALYKSLLAGEINELAGTILKLSGFDQDFNDTVEDAKN
jgi:hypothetical protein